MLIQGVKGIYRIEHYSLHKEKNQHSQLEFSALMAAGSNVDCNQLLWQPVQAFLEKDGKADSLLIFHGVIISARKEQSYHETRLYVQADSASILLDKEPQWHLFQAENKTMNDILTVTQKDFPANVLLKVDSEVGKQVVPAIIMQREETPFSFLRRCAQAIQSCLWVEDSRAGMTILHLRLQLQSKAKVVREQSIRHLTTEADWQGTSLRAELTEYVDVGSLLTFPEQDGVYLVTALTLDYEQGRDVYRYQLQKYVKTKQAKVNFADEQAYRLLAYIINHQDPKHLGRVQVQYDLPQPWQVMDADKPRWLSYRSPYVGKKGGIVFLPDVGDSVEITILQGEAYAATSYRSLPLGQENGNVKDKYIGNNFQRRVLWKEKSLELLSGKNKIVMTDEAIELVVGKSRLRLDDKGIILQNESNQIVLDSDLQMLSKSKATLAGESAAALQSKGQVLVDGNQQASLQSQGTIKLVAQQQARIQGNGVDVKSNGALNLAGTTVNLC